MSDARFPDVNPGFKPVGRKVLIQLQKSATVSPGGILFLPEEVDAKDAVAVIAKVIAVGDMAYRDADTGEFWPTGAWCKPGDISRWPKYGGDRFRVGTDKDGVHFKFFDDRDMIATVENDT